MKKEYITPAMYIEEFVPNEYATTCKPGVDETKAKPYLQQCYYYTNPGILSECSKRNESFYFLTENTTGCTVKLTSTGDISIAETSLQSERWDFEHPNLQVIAPSLHESHKVASYRWPNGEGGWHHIPVSQLGGVDTETGLPLYFNS